MADKSFSCYAGILGILMAGKGYLPLNPRFPNARNLYMMEKAHVGIFIAGDIPDENLDLMLDSYPGRIFVIIPRCGTTSHSSWEVIFNNNPAYLLFTSGTTGKPKGVPVSSRNASSYLDFMLKTLRFSAGRPLHSKF